MLDEMVKDLFRTDRDYLHVVLVSPSADGLGVDYDLCLCVVQGMALSDLEIIRMIPRYTKIHYV
jgi:hypothetical protein